ncbi:MAG: hypothetical protein LBG79_03685 [Spirochaetaceae bacterium]|nr:hypothetical protein [Spirochaetaceae bacterium]
MKYVTRVVLLFALTARYGSAIDFTDELQYLTVETACAGQYNRAQSGIYGCKDPRNYYRPGGISPRQSAGSVLETFYGNCFDYATAAYNIIKEDQSRYEALGVKKWYIAAVGNNSRQITLYEPAARENPPALTSGMSAGMSAGTLLKEISRQNAYAHSGAKITHGFGYMVRTALSTGSTPHGQTTQAIHGGA